MTEPLESSGFRLLLLLAGGVVLFASAWALSQVVRFVPMGRDRRELVARMTPALAALLGLGYALVAVRELFRGQPTSVPFALALVVAGFGAAAWFAMRDLLAGVVLRAGHFCQVGDQIEVDGVKGRVRRMGYRVLWIETSRGDEAIVPYSRIARASMLRTPATQGMALHVFRVKASADASIADVRRTARESALLCHWASALRDPELVAVGPNEFEVTVFALDRDHAPEVESAVRKALGSLQS